MPRPWKRISEAYANGVAAVAVELLITSSQLLGEMDTLARLKWSADSAQNITKCMTW